MGTIYAVANQKGGVGKTTTAVNLAACVAEAGYETLLVDVDPQANATTGLGLFKDDPPSTYDVLSGETAWAEAVKATGVERLSLISSSPDLAGANAELPRLPGSEQRLREALAARTPAGDGNGSPGADGVREAVREATGSAGAAGVREAFPFCFLDCPPSLGPLTVNALVAADRVIVPVQTEYYALEGLAGLLDTLDLIRRELNSNLTVAGMLLTMHDGRTRLAQDVEAEVRRHFPELVFETVIPRNVRIGEAPSFGKPVIHHDPSCPGADAYFSLAKEVAARG